MKNKKILKKVKAQGLPMNFVVIAVMAVLVLLAVVMFFFTGFRTEAVGMQSAVNVCDSRCSVETRSAVNLDSRGYSNSNSHFCAITQDIQGFDDSVRCDEITSCRVTFRDGSNCVLQCNGETSRCSY